MNMYRNTWPLLLAALLSACGGGSSSDGNSSTPPPSGNGNGGTSGGSYSDAETLSAFQRLNLARSQAGLAPLAQNGKLDQAAAAHTSYQVTNNVEGHYETAGQPGFTGQSPGDRVTAAGYTYSFVGEVISAGTPSLSASSLVDGLLAAPYHRVLMLMFKPSQVGVSAKSGQLKYLTIDMAYGPNDGPAAPGLTAVLWPAPSATGVLRSGCCESPAPPVGVQTWGYPVSVQVMEGRTLATTSFTLVDAQGQSVSTKLLTSANDPNLQGERNVAVLMPLAPLAANATYTASFAGTIDGAPYVQTWSFTTGG